MVEGGGVSHSFLHRLWKTFFKKGVTAMLVGEYQHSVDAKGRMIMPAKFREELGDSFVVTKGLDNSLFIFSKEEWARLDEKLAQLPLSKGRTMQRFFYGSMAECEIDKQGRVLLPANLREYASLEKDVVVVGLNRRAEIWSKDKWDEQNESFMESADDVALQMEDLGI